jgi:hypothetical protein
MASNHGWLNRSGIPGVGCSNFPIKVRPEIAETPTQTKSLAMYTPNWKRAAPNPFEFLTADTEPRLQIFDLNQSLKS